MDISIFKYSIRIMNISNKHMCICLACCLALRENDSGLIDWPAMKFLDYYAYFKAKN